MTILLLHASDKTSQNKDLKKAQELLKQHRKQFL